VLVDANSATLLGSLVFPKVGGRRPVNGKER
jgi:hypothetical protein